MAITTQNTIRQGNTDFRARALVDEVGNQTGISANPLKVSTASGGGASVDAFGRQRVSDPHSIFHAAFPYGEQIHLYDNANVALGGIITDLLLEAALLLSVTAQVGSMITNYSSQRIRYQPGRSQYILMTGNFQGHVVGIEKRIGLFDNEDGLYFLSDGTTMNVAVRTSTAGTPSQTKVPQSLWNLDKMDGSGPSGIIIDWTQAQIFVIDFQWLGVGRVRYGLDIGGDIIYVHETNNANNLPLVYMANPHLFMGYEIKNITGVNTGTLKQICSSAFSEGGYEVQGRLRSHSSGTIPVLCADGLANGGILTPVLSIQPALLLKGRPNKGTMIMVDMDILTTGTVPIHWEIVEDAVLTGAIWTPHSIVNSMGEHDVTATAMSGGRAVHEGYGTSNKNKGSIISEQRIDMRMVINPDGHQDTITVGAMGIGAATNCFVSVSWRELL